MPNQIPFPPNAYPVLGSSYSNDAFVKLDLSRNSSLLEGWTSGDMKGLEDRIWTHINKEKGLVGWGGYLEDRSLYEVSDHFQTASSFRSIHLGLDVWAPAGQRLYAPLDGRVHSFGYNDQPQDYGATIILEHTYLAHTFYTLYGHLALRDLEHLEPGLEIEKGQKLAHIGPPEENGGWAPHLHLQLILDLGEWKGDFPGVAFPEEIREWAENCLDPGWLVMGREWEDGGLWWQLG